MRIESERLYLYPISNEEMELLIANEKDEEMKQAYEEMLQGCIASPSTRIWNAVWYMELKESRGTIVGDFSFKGLGKDGVVEIGYGLKAGFCGKGYMTEAVRSIAKWALSQEGVTKVEAETTLDNAASKQVLLRAGFKENGVQGEEGPRYVFVM